MATNKHELRNNKQVLLGLVKAGLWERDVELRKYGATDYSQILQLAMEQSVVGLVAAGLERVKDMKVPQEWALQFIGQTLQIEQRNKAMNGFIAELVEKMREAGIYTLLVKGQGVAQCYEKPLWRPSGDVDFLLSEENYKKAKEFLLPLSSGNKNEERYSRHLGMSIGEWYVEIHGTLRTGLSARVDKIVDAVQNNVFYGGKVRSWMNGKTQMFLPAPTEDVFLVFTHFIKHFYKEGMSLRQVCDWCRLLYTYRGELDYGLLESWIRKTGLMSEWQGFAAVAVEYLGMPEDAMPLIKFRDESLEFRDRLKDREYRKYKKKAEKIIRFILNGSHGKVKDTWRIGKIFPWHTFKFLPSIFLNVNGLKIKERILMVHD